MKSRSEDQILIQFWGVRDSIPTPQNSLEIESKIYDLIKESLNENLSSDDSIKTFIERQPLYKRGVVGGNTSCVYLRIGKEHIIFDAGSGIRRLGDKLMQEEFGKGRGVVHLFLSHTHWDHIMGFPFFQPAFISGNRVNIYGVHSALEQRISGQQEDKYFPVPLVSMGANIEFFQLHKRESINIGDINITNEFLNHPGGSFGYRLSYRGKSVVHATDSEYKNIGEERLEKYINFFRSADILIYDSQYTLSESIEKENWGHSTFLQGINFAKKADVKHLVLFHHDPSYSDEKLFNILADAKKYLRSESADAQNLKVSLAIEGIELIL